MSNNTTQTIALWDTLLEQNYLQSLGMFTKMCLNINEIQTNDFISKFAAYHSASSILTTHLSSENSQSMLHWWVRRRGTCKRLLSSLCPPASPYSYSYGYDQSRIKKWRACNNVRTLWLSSLMSVSNPSKFSLYILCWDFLAHKLACFKEGKQQTTFTKVSTVIIY